MRKLAILLLSAALSATALTAQINIGGQPLSFKTQLRGQVPTIAMPALDLAAVAKEDLEDEAQGMPPRFGYPHDAGYDLRNSGQWESLPDGSRVWRLSLYCPGAKSINLLYDAFWLPQGATLYIYNAARTHVIGGFTARNNNSPRGQSIGYATGLVYGDRITLELHEPARPEAPAELAIAQVVHGYRYIRAFEDSGGCQLNVNCDDGADWQAEKTSVALILIGGTRWCTGSLLNNSLVDFTPYFLTAHHCLNGLDAVDDPNAANWSFMWNYESPDCANPAEEPGATVTTGAILVANRNDSDFALFRLTEDPWLDAGMALLYNGWSTANPGAGGAGIHHPRGDIKKISLYQQTPFDNTTNTCLNANRWGVIFEHPDGSFTTTEPGSSGSPLFDNNHRVIGQLWGGFHLDDCSGGPTCADPAKDLSFYGKFSVSWAGASPARRLQDWLAPKCETDLYVGTDIAIGAPTFHASNALTADNEISGAVTYVVYNGGFEVVLSEGFEARDGANFMARNFNCSNGSFNAMDATSTPHYAEGRSESTKTAPPPASPVEAAAAESFTLYPNPASDLLSLNYTVAEDGERSLQIVNQYGQTVATVEAPAFRPRGEYTRQVPVDGWPSGLYYAVLASSGGRQVQPFVVARR
jgi:lysyl endopeptidase